MKKVLLYGLFMISLTSISVAQSIVGKWQLSKQSMCVEDELGDDTNELAAEMKSMSPPGRQILHLKDNNTIEESTRIINNRKSYNTKALLYKYTGDALYILDKRSKTIIESFVVEQLSADSLIISNSARACETKVFVKIE